MGLIEAIKRSEYSVKEGVGAAGTVDLGERTSASRLEKELKSKKDKAKEIKAKEEADEKKEKLDKKKERVLGITVEETVEDEEIKVIDKVTESANVTYSVSPEELASLYGNSSFNLEEMWYGTAPRTSTGKEMEEEYSNLKIISKNGVMTLTNEEAQESFRKIQYEAAANRVGEVSFIERERFDLWVQFNKVQLRMFEALYGVTSEVNYSQLR